MRRNNQKRERKQKSNCYRNKRKDETPKKNQHEYGRNAGVKINAPHPPWPSPVGTRRKNEPIVRKLESGCRNCSDSRRNFII